VYFKIVCTFVVTDLYSDKGRVGALLFFFSFFLLFLFASVRAQVGALMELLSMCERLKH
jgi:hypothetical protein